MASFHECAESAAFLVRKARTRLLLEHPFFGTVAMGLTLLADPDAPTAWTDGRVLGYRPAYVQVLPFETLKGLIAHLVLHTALGHHVRRGDREPGLWNMACDHTINWMLAEAGFRLPEGYLDDPEFRRLPAETVYERLRQRREKEAGQGQASPGSGEGGDGREMEGEGPEGDRIPGDRGPGGEGAEGLAEDREEEGRGETEGEMEAEKRPEEGGGDPGGGGEVRDQEKPGEGRDGEARPGTLEALVARALLTERDCGDLSGDILRRIRETLEPGLDWRMLLSRFIERSARSDYAWSPPNRRYLHQGLYLPSVRSDEADRIVIVVDTSGSISHGELDLFCAEVSAILAAFPGEILVMGCDRAVGEVFSLSSPDLPFAPCFTGGGGTDFRAPFHWLEKEGITPRCLIYLTDLACHHYPEEPAFPVLWAVCGGLAERPPFGQRLFLAA